MRATPRPRPFSMLISGKLPLMLVLIVVASASLVHSENGADSLDDTSPIDVYFINLYRRPDRERHMRAEFERQGVVPPKFIVHRFEAIDGLTHTFTQDEVALFRTFDDKFGSNNNTALLKANSLSHLGVWKLVLKSNAPYAIVFQDDAQLSNDFVESLQDVIQHNPSDALVTWLGLNNYASGSVSRSAPLQHDKYDPNLASTALPGGVVGRCRPNLVSTNSLAYLLTRRGAEIMVKEFGTTSGQGWTHHTDHAMVEFLDERKVSYISRKVLATTHDDGILGSDIFHDNEQELAAKHAEDMVRRALQYARLKVDDAIAAATNNNGKSVKEELPWLDGLNVKCEEMKCLFPDCPVPVVTFCFLSWDNNKDEGRCESGEDGTCSITEEDDWVVDDLGVRRHGSRKQLFLGAAPSDVTPELAAESIPAWWVLEAWASGKHNVQRAPRPRFSKGDAVDANFSTDSSPKWEPGVVAAVGYRQDSWPEGSVATYIIRHQDGRFLTVVIDNPTKIRPRASDDSDKAKYE